MHRKGWYPSARWLPLPLLWWKWPPRNNVRYKSNSIATCLCFSAMMGSTKSACSLSISDCSFTLEAVADFFASSNCSSRNADRFSKICNWALSNKPRYGGIFLLELHDLKSEFLILALHCITLFFHSLHTLFHSFRGGWVRFQLSIGDIDLLCLLLTQWNKHTYAFEILLLQILNFSLQCLNSKLEGIHINDFLTV